MVHGTQTTNINCEKTTQDNEGHGRALSVLAQQQKMRRTELTEHETQMT